MVMSTQAFDIIKLQQEHEAIRVYLQQLNKIVSSLERLPVATEQAQFELLKGKIMSLDIALNHFKHGIQEHIERDDNLLVRMDTDLAQALVNQHRKITDEIDRTLFTISVGQLVEDNLEALRQRTQPVREAFRELYDAAEKNISAEDQIISTLVG